MKTLFTILLIIVVWQAFGQWSNLAEIRFISTVPRTGFTDEVILSRDSVKVLSYTKQLPKHVNVLKATLNNDWPEQLILIHLDSLAQIAYLTAPPTRAYKANFRHSELIFTDTQGKRYVHVFENENPHVILQPLLKQILIEKKL